jgi:hypothetical protein
VFTVMSRGMIVERNPPWPTPIAEGASLPASRYHLRIEPQREGGSICCTASVIPAA